MTNGRRLLFSPATWVTVLAIFISLLVLPHFNSLSASDKTYVSVFADGEERHLVSGPSTVGELLRKIDVQVAEVDLVEPSLDTPIVGGLVNVNVYRARAVKIVDGSDEKIVLSPYQSARIIAENAGFTVYDEDRFKTEVVTKFTDEGFVGTKLILQRATPINISVDGTDLDARTWAKTVGEALEEQGVVLREDDFTIPAESTYVHSNQEIKIVRVGKKVVSKEVSIPYTTHTVTDYNLPIGFVRQESKGKNGSELVTYEIVTHDGKESVRKRLSKKIRVKPINEVIVVGGSNNGIVALGNVELARKMAEERGWTGEDWEALYNIIWHESKFNQFARNPSSGACGIPQALPCSKMSVAGSDYATNPRTQLVWLFDHYIVPRYGGPQGAWEFWQANNWY